MERRIKNATLDDVVQITVSGAMSKLSVDRTLQKAKSFAKKGQFAEAVKLYQQVLEVFPQNKRAQQGLSSLIEVSGRNVQNPPQELVDQLVALYTQGQLEAAVEQAQAATRQYPQAFVIWNILGGANKGLDRLDAAIEAFKQVTVLSPKYPNGFNNLGVVLQAQCEFGAAVDAYKRALMLKPDYAEAYNNLGSTYADQGDLEQAIEVYAKALSLKSDYFSAYYNMGNALRHLGRLDVAVEEYKKALSLRILHIEMYHKIGSALSECGRFDLAIEAYDKCLSLHPNDQMTRAIKYQELAGICDWSSLQKDSNLFAKLGVFEQAVYPFSLLPLEDAPERHRLRSETFGRGASPQLSLAVPSRPLKRPERLRIGYFSADFHNHATMYLMAKVFEVHNRGDFEIYAYSFGPDKKDTMRTRLTEAVDNFRDIRGLSEQDAAKQAQEDRLDIAIDLKGYTMGERFGIFAYRPAPIQISYLGYPGTSGSMHMDYLVADKIVIPQKNESFYSEAIIQLPHSYQVNDNTRVISDRVITRADVGLPDQGFVFCCFNNNYKISPAEFDIWMRLLGQVEGSVLWLLKSNKWAEANLRMEAKKRGISSERVVFAEKIAQSKHLGRHRLADLFLDTFNVNAHTTTSDALWAGLPVVTKMGRGFAARVAGSLLGAVGLPELITETAGDYEALILALATGPHRLAVIRQKFAANRLSAPLFDTELFTRHLENGYQQAYQNYFDGEAPKRIFVPADC